jgi:hypothetical protein
MLGIATGVAIGSIIPNRVKADAQYYVEVNELWEIRGTESTTSGEHIITNDARGVFGISLTLNWSYICGTPCGSGFDRQKRVFFYETQEFTALFMPELWTSDN